MELKTRAHNFILEIGIPMTKFAQRVNLCRQSIYRWLQGDLNLSADSLNRIDTYLTKYGF